MSLREELLGRGPARRRMVVAAGAVPVAASVAFLLRLDASLPVWALAIGTGVVVAVYAGWDDGGFLPGGGAVFLAVLWGYAVPQSIGYLRGSWDSRYAYPRVLGYEQPPRAELVDGLTTGPLVAILVAVLLGGGAFLLGRRLRRRVKGSSA